MHVLNIAVLCSRQQWWPERRTSLPLRFIRCNRCATANQPTYCSGFVFLGTVERAWAIRSYVSNRAMMGASDNSSCNDVRQFLALNPSFSFSNCDLSRCSSVLCDNVHQARCMRSDWASIINMQICMHVVVSLNIFCAGVILDHWPYFSLSGWVPLAIR